MEFKIKIKEYLNRLGAFFKRLPQTIKNNRKRIFEYGVSAVLVLALIVSYSLSALSLCGVGVTKAEDGTSYTVINYDPAMRRTAATVSMGELKLKVLSVELDLSITVLNEKDEVVTGVPFEFKISPKNSSSNVITAVDDDMDGTVYISDISDGSYNVALQAVAGVLAKTITTVAAVEPKVTYVKKDVSKLVVSEKDINAAEDDAKYNSGGNTGANTTRPAVANTVEYVESSTKTDTKNTETPLLDANGVQVVKYKPVVTVGADGKNYINFANGSASTVWVTLDADGYITEAWRIDAGGAEEEGAAVDPAVTPEPEPEPEPEPAPEPSPTNVLLEVIASGVPVKDASGNPVYQFTAVPQVTVKSESVTTYYGWQTLNGKTYYYDKNGNKVTGWQIINGANYYFDSDGARGGGSNGNLGIDVSTWQENVDWAKVKASGIDFVFVRLGFRGYSSGKLVLDNEYRSHVQGASAAGLKVGVYFFTQAITEAEAVEEASMCLQYVQGYNISYPIVIDVEYSGSSSGRANNLTASQRTKVTRAFCETIRSAGYTPGVYANKNYFESYLYASELESYVIWLAHYTDKTSYARRYDIWQYSSKGSVNGINGYVDMNLCYLGY